MTAIFTLIRPKEWVKNFFVFVPLFFGGALFDSQKMVLCIAGFILFSMAASAVYIFNDLKDLPFDAQHPTKKNRPLASGAIKPNTAIVIMVILCLLTLSGAFFISTGAGIVISLYLLINLAYSLYLKHIAIIDITCIASGFLLRVIIGGVLTGITLSTWLLIMTFLVSLFLGFGKRRDDVLIMNESGNKMRKSVDGYNMEFINAAMVLMASILIVCYINYITSPEVTKRIKQPYFFVSAFFVIVGLLRYLQITLVLQKSGSPTKIVTSDFLILSMILLWIAHFITSIYL